MRTSLRTLSQLINQLTVKYLVRRICKEYTVEQISYPDGEKGRPLSWVFDVHAGISSVYCSL